MITLWRNYTIPIPQSSSPLLNLCERVSFTCRVSSLWDKWINPFLEIIDLIPDQSSYKWCFFKKCETLPRRIAYTSAHTLPALLKSFDFFKSSPNQTFIFCRFVTWKWSLLTVNSLLWTSGIFWGIIWKERITGWNYIPFEWRILISMPIIVRLGLSLLFTAYFPSWKKSGNGM